MDRQHKGKEVMELMELNSVGDLNKHIWSNTVILWPRTVRRELKILENKFIGNPQLLKYLILLKQSNQGGLSPDILLMISSAEVYLNS